jgi:hypothetical protein
LDSNEVDNDGCLDEPRGSIERGKRAPLADISPQNSKRINGDIALPIPEQVTTAPFPHGHHTRNYTPAHINSKLEYSSIDWKWHNKQGKEFDKAFRPKTRAKKKDRSINLALLGALHWGLLSFIYFSRCLKARAEALVVQSLFMVLLEQYPEYFKDIF